MTKALSLNHNLIVVHRLLAVHKSVFSNVVATYPVLGIQDRAPSGTGSRLLTRKVRLRGHIAASLHTFTCVDSMVV